MRREVAGGDCIAVAVDVVIVVGGVFGGLYEQCDDPAPFRPVVSPPEVAAMVPPPFNGVVDFFDAILSLTWDDGAHVSWDAAFRRDEMGISLRWRGGEYVKGKIRKPVVAARYLEGNLDGESPIRYGENLPDWYIQVEGSNSTVH